MPKEIARFSRFAASIRRGAIWGGNMLHGGLQSLASLACLPIPALGVLTGLVLMPAHLQAQDGSAARPPSTPQQRSALTGDWGGARTQLRERGLTLDLKYSAEVFHVPAGGIHQGTVYEDLIALTVDADLSKMAGVEGGGSMPRHSRSTMAGHRGSLAAIFLISAPSRWPAIVKPAGSHYGINRIYGTICSRYGSAKSPRPKISCTAPQAKIS